MGKNPKYGTWEEDNAKINLWNHTVNVFRRIAGMEPFPEDEEEDNERVPGETTETERT